MKITKFLLFSLAVVLFSCGDDEEFIPTREGMVGTWSVTGINYSGTTTTTVIGVNIKATFTGTGKDMDMTTTFTTEPNIVTSEGSYTIELKTTVGGVSETEDVVFDEAITDGTWTLDGKTLTVTNPSGTQEGTVTKQTETTLQVQVAYDETTSDAGVTIRNQIKAVYTFERI